MKKMRLTITMIMIMAAFLTACGTNDTNKANEEAIETTTEPVVTEATDVEKTEETVETPAAGPYDNLEDWVIGKDIWVYENKRMVSNLPELAIKLPSKYNLLSVDEYSNANDYNIGVPTTDNFIVVHSSLKWAKNEDLCISESMHKELTNYGKYSFDWGYVNNTANIAVGCPDVDTSILITFNIYKQDKTDDRKSTTDEAKAEFEKFVNTNVEYVREQVQAWDQNYVPTGELSPTNVSANNEPTEEKELIVPEENIPVDEEAINAFYRTYKQIDGSCEFTIEQGENGNDTITANDGANSYEFVMKVLGEGTYGVYLGDTEVFEIYEEDTGREVYVIDDTYSAFSGIYE